MGGTREAEGCGGGSKRGPVARRARAAANVDRPVYSPATIVQWRVSFYGSFRPRTTLEP